MFAWLDVPFVPTAGGAAALLIIVAYRLVTDRSAVMAEVATLKEQLAATNGQVRDLRTQVDHNTALYDEQRGLKHQAFNDIARALTALELVRRLATECTCGVLSPLSEIIARILDEMETSRHRRLSDTKETP